MIRALQSEIGAGFRLRLWFATRVTRHGGWHCSDRIESRLSSASLYRDPDFAVALLKGREHAVDDVFLAVEQAFQPARVQLVQTLDEQQIGKALQQNTLTSIRDLIHPALLGVMGTGLAGNVVHTLTESRFHRPEFDLVARWGILPPGASVDPNAIEPVASQSWILDLDLSTSVPSGFDLDAIIARGAMFAERAYTVFRWAVADAFLERYGDDLS